MRPTLRRLLNLISPRSGQPTSTRDRGFARSGRAIPGRSGAPSSKPPPRPIPRKLLKAQNTYVFSLAPIRTKLGDRWEQFAPSVHRIANRLIFSRMDGRGTFERFGDSYVLSFDHLRGKRARAEGERNYRRFMELLSKGDGSDGTDETRTQYSDGKNQDNGDGLLRRLMRRLRSLFQRDDVDASNGVADETDASDADGAELELRAEEGTGQAGEQRLAAPSARSSEVTARRVRAKRFKPLLDVQDGPEAPLHAQAPKDKHLENLKLLREARAMENAVALAVLRRQSAGFDPANNSFPPPDLGFIYRSMWNLRTRYLTTYTSVPICWKSSMEVHHGEEVVPSLRRPEHLFELDFQCLENTIEILKRLTKKKRPVLFMNAVHASTLADKDMMGDLRALLKSMPPAARKQLIFEIVDVADYAHHTDAIHFVRALLPFARAVTASVGLQDRSFAFWKQCGFMAVGADTARDRRMEEEIISSMPHFAAQAKRQKLLSYLRELDTFSLTVSAAAAGFDFLEGALIGSSDDPDNLTLSRFDMGTLYEETREMVWAS